MNTDHMEINHMTLAHRCVCEGGKKHTLDVQAARDGQLRRAQNRDQRLRRRQRILTFCVDLALIATVTVAVLAAIGLLATAVS